MATDFISRTITRIREELDEPSTNAKYTDSRLIEYIEMVYPAVIQEINRISEHPIVPYVDISIVSGTSVYELPPTIHKIVDMYEVSTSGEYDQIVQNHTPSRIRGGVSWPGMTLQHNVIRYMPGYEPTYDFTLRVFFVPDGCARLHTSQIAGNAVSNDTSTNTATITLDTSPDTGTYDNRPNAYVGSVFRTIEASENDYVFDRVITAFDVATGVVTVEPAYPATQIPGDEDAGETLTYEIAPPLSEALDWQIGLAVAEHIASFERDAERVGLLNRQFQKVSRTARLNHAHYNTITAPAMQSSARRNSNHIPGPYRNLLR